jgi:hypothetical protein
MATDIEILRRALDRENDTRRPPHMRHWEYYAVGATKADVKRLVDQGYVFIESGGGSITKYKLTEKGKNVVWAETMERKFDRVSKQEILEAFNLVVGYDDIKQKLAQTLSSGRRVNYLFEGPPACAKSVILEAIRSAIPSAYLAFGSRTSAAGLSDVLFELRPPVLLLDEADKMKGHDKGDIYSVLLGVMETGEILETKSKKTRGIILETSVIAACNSSKMMSRAFLSRFAFHPHFPEYTRTEFIDVVVGMLTMKEDCPEDIAKLIGARVYDLQLGDIRKARGIWDLMESPTVEQVEEAILLNTRYAENSNGGKNKPALGLFQRLL